MIMIVDKIDAISRRLERDVLFLHMRQRRRQKNESLVARATKWLDAHGMRWEKCISYVPGVIFVDGGPWAIFIDVEYVPDSHEVSMLIDEFEIEGGLPKDPDLVLSLLTYEEAMRNADQDDESFWENI